MNINYGMELPLGYYSLRLPKKEKLFDWSSLDDTKGGVLKKAVSFRNDWKSRISRNSSGGMGAESKTLKPVKKKPSFSRSGSFNDGNKVPVVIKKDDGAGKMELETKKVFQALRYIQDVVDKGIVEQLHGSVTIVLDQIIEFESLFLKCISSQESNQLQSALGGLHQNLAKLMSLADRVMLNQEPGSFVNKQEATDQISLIKTNVQDLSSLSEENAKDAKCQKTLTEGAGDVADQCSGSESSQTLDDQDEMNPLGLSKNAKSRSAENILDVCQSQDDLDGSSDCQDLSVSDVPPPKPPLPRLNWPVGKFNSMPRSLTVKSCTDDVPPPLPEKKRNSAGIYESDTPNNRSFLSLTRTNIVPISCSRSPANSISSAFSASSEEMLDEAPPKPSRVPSNSLIRRDSRGSQYDNVTDSAFDRSFSFDADSTIDGSVKADDDSGHPPPLPAKKGNSLCRRLGSEYDNLAADQSLAHKSSGYFSDANSEQLSCLLGQVQQDTASDVGISSPVQRRFITKVTEVHRKTITAAGSQNTFMRSSQLDYSEEFSTDGSQQPPPVPPKKHVQAYLEVFGERSSSSLEFGNTMRHSVYCEKTSSWNQNDLSLVGSSALHGGPAYHFPGLQIHSSSFQSLQNCLPNYPPSLYSTFNNMSCMKNSEEDDDLKPPVPPKPRDQTVSQYTLDSGYGGSVKDCNAVSSLLTVAGSGHEGVSVNDKHGSVASHDKESSDSDTSPAISDVSNSTVASTSIAAVPPETEAKTEGNILEEEDVTSRLTFKKPNEDGTDIRGGSVDALIVHATTPGQTDFTYQEAFLMTYRTFISSTDLIKKLLQRYNRFSRVDSLKKKKLSRNAFSFLVRVVDELCRDTDKQMLEDLMGLSAQLASDGELHMSSIMRKLAIEKCENYFKQTGSHSITLLSSYQLTAKTHTIVEFKASHIAEQMTLLDAELFNKIENPEVLRWSREQSEEHSPNLTKFTEHFNKMSYWCRTRILEQEEPKERERHLMKFIKIMKHLRRLNNFNSYLAILSAVDSAPVRRLEWQKQNVEALKELCQLIDSTASFRAYRQVLAETSPPCIPYIGLILQDLTFVNIGNLDYLPDGNINFSKCWQYYTILQNMSRFRKCIYNFKKNGKIIAFFNNFDSYISEDSLWQISEMIKPRAGKTPAKQPD